MLSIQVQLLIFPKITTLPWQTVRAAFTHRFHRGPEIVESHVVYAAGEGSMFVVYERNDPPKAENTAMGYEVADVVAAVKWLKEKGVVFEEYDFPGLKTVDGIADVGGNKGAWFKDPDGNILAVSEAS